MGIFSRHHELQLDRIEANQALLLTFLERIEHQMSALSDAVSANNVAVATVQASVNTAIAKIEAIQAPSDAADVQAAIDALGTSTSTLTAAAAALDAANPPAPAA